jgi:hypothetical protein
MFLYMPNPLFATAPDGTRLFIPWGCLSRPYIVPDAVTERRLAKTILWALGACFGSMFLSAPFVLLYLPQVFEEPWTVGYFFLFVAVSCAVVILILRLAVRGLRRADRPLTIRAIYLNNAKASTVPLVCLALFSWACTLGTVCAIGFGFDPIFGSIWAVLSGISGVGAGYTLFLKYTRQA